jgi:flagellar biosynthesis protein FlhF
MPTRIKRYEDRIERYDALLARIETEMGSEAELELREFRRGGLFGVFGGRRMVEVIATLQIPATAPAAGPAPSRPAPPRRVDIQADAPLPSPAEQQPANGTREKPGPPQPTASLASTPAAVARPAATPPAAAPPATSTPEPAALHTTSGELDSLQAELEALRHTVQLLAAQQPEPRPEFSDAVIRQSEAPQLASRESGEPHSNGQPGRPPATVIDTLAREPLSPPPPVVADPLALDPGAQLNRPQRSVYDRLLYWNVGPYDALELLNTALGCWQEAAEPGEAALMQMIHREICRGILLSGGIQLRRSPPGKAVALVGATGVGKTTTIAKLAAQFAFQQGRRVSLVSLDNYRIAAAEQLRTYTEIMGLELDIVFTKDEFDSVMTRRRQDDLVLIDTAGRSPQNARQIYELKEIFAVHPPDEVHLVVAASTKADDMRAILDNFQPLGYDHVIISKLDETQSLGSIYNLTRLSKLPLSYVTVGQSVPEDIRPATPAFVQAWIEQGKIS